jgi:hypothetical protein
MDTTTDVIRIQALYFISRAQQELEESGADPADPHGALARDLLDKIYNQSCDDYLGEEEDGDLHPATDLWILGHQVARGAAMGFCSFPPPTAAVRLIAARQEIEACLSPDATTDDSC